MARVVTVHSPRIDTLIDSQQRHTHTLGIAVGKGPEATMSVSILGTDPGMHHEGSTRRNREDAFLQERLASRDRDVGLSLPDEFQRLFAVGARGVVNGQR